MTENQGLVETTFGVRRVAVHAQFDATRLNWILGQASNKSCDVDDKMCTSSPTNDCPCAWSCCSPNSRPPPWMTDWRFHRNRRQFYWRSRSFPLRKLAKSQRVPSLSDSVLFWTKDKSANEITWFWGAHANEERTNLMTIRFYLMAWIFDGGR